jgi:hypothetical protein
MPKGNKYGTTISVKQNGMRAIAGETGIQKRRINISQAREHLLLEQMKESMNSKPSKNNVCMNCVGGQQLMKLNENSC